MELRIPSLQLHCCLCFHPCGWSDCAVLLGVVQEKQQRLVDQNITSWTGKSCTIVSWFILMPFGNSSGWKLYSSKWTYHPAMHINHWILQAQRFPFFFWEVILIFLRKLNLKVFGHSFATTTLGDKTLAQPKLLRGLQPRFTHGPTLGPTCPPHDRPRQLGATTTSGWIVKWMPHVLLMCYIFQIFQPIVGWIAIQMMHLPCVCIRRRPYKSKSH